MKRYLIPLFLIGTAVLSEGQPADKGEGVPLPPGQAAELRRSLDRAQVDVENTFRDAQNRYDSVVALYSSDAAGPAGPGAGSLIVPRDATDPKALGDLEEDLSVMSRILEKAAGPNDKSRSAMGIPVNRKFFGNSPRNMYIEGYGALFFLHVNFPLVAPSVDKNETPAKSETSNEWEEARRELSAPTPNGVTFTYSPNNFDTWTATGIGASQEYDADRVEDLKKGLVAALKNAAHIRKLKPDDLVTVVVTSHNTFNTRAPAKMIRRSDSRTGPNPPPAPQPPPPPPALQPGRETKLIIRARRADIEAFQKDKLTVEEFRKKANVMIY